MIVAGLGDVVAGAGVEVQRAGLGGDRLAVGAVAAVAGAPKTRIGTGVPSGLVRGVLGIDAQDAALDVGAAGVDVLDRPGAVVEDDGVGRWCRLTRSLVGVAPSFLTRPLSVRSWL